MQERSEQNQVALSEEERMIVEELERLPIENGNLMDLLLVWRGLKQATDFRLTLHEWSDRESIVGPFTPDERKRIEGKIVNIFGSMGLSYIKDPRSPVKTVNVYGDEEVGEPEELAGSLELLFYVSSDMKKSRKALRDFEFLEQRERDRRL